MNSFCFHGELFEYRAEALDALSAGGFSYFESFGSIDLTHDSFGLEVSEIADETTALSMQRILRARFPGWHSYVFEDQEEYTSCRWWVRIHRDSESSSE